MDDDLYSIADRSAYNSDFLSGGGASEFGSIDGDGNESAFHPTVARRENRAVKRAKMLLACALLVCVSSSVGGVYTRVTASEYEEFQNRVSITERYVSSDLAAILN